MKSRYDQMWDMFGSCNHKVLRYTLQCQTRSLEKNNNNSKIRRCIKLPHWPLILVFPTLWRKIFRMILNTYLTKNVFALTKYMPKAHCKLKCLDYIWLSASAWTIEKIYTSVGKRYLSILFSSQLIKEWNASRCIRIKNLISSCVAIFEKLDNKKGRYFDFSIARHNIYQCFIFFCFLLFDLTKHMFLRI